MAKYSREDLEIVQATDFLKSRRLDFFFGREPSGEVLACGLVRDALLLGGSRVTTAHELDLWAVASNNDWLGTETDEVLETLFSRMNSFAEGGVNSVRSEVLLRPFCIDVFTCTPDSEFLVQGCAHELKRFIGEIHDWQRIVAFRFGDADECEAAREEKR